MPVWIPVLKASLPYITQIVTSAIPAFTAKASTDKAFELVPKQIEELQTAVTHNAESVKALATQLKETIEGIEAGATRLEREMKGLRLLTLAALVLAGAALAVAL